MIFFYATLTIIISLKICRNYVFASLGHVISLFCACIGSCQFVKKKKKNLNDLMWMSWNGKRGEEPGHVLLDAEGGGAGGGQLPPPLHHHPRTVRQLITENTKNIRNAFFIVFVVVAHPVPTLLKMVNNW